MRGKNLLFIFSDEHQRDLSGCYGDPIIQTPNIDSLAENGTRFTNAYTNCPICVPARASLATGQYVHKIRCWDNAQPYYGQFPSWGHNLIEDGHEVISVGKLHYRSNSDSNGFSKEIEELHIVDGLGDLLGMVRTPPAPRGNIEALARDAGSGESTYYNYDLTIGEAAANWISDEGPKTEKPWTLFAGFVLPHFPLVGPTELFDYYKNANIPMPRQYGHDERPRHPAVRAISECMNYGDYFDEEAIRTGRAAYYAMTTAMDKQVGKLLDAVRASGQWEDTRIIYCSDHGDNLGNRGLWGKSVMYEEAAAIPMIIAGADIPKGAVIDTPVSLVDVYPTIVEAVGGSLTEEEMSIIDGHSLIDIANGATPERTILSEYHAAASITGSFMIRVDKWKYVHHQGFAPELYDMEADPRETNDLGEDPAHAETIAMCDEKLRAIVDPKAVTEQAFSDQAERIAQHGGEDAIKERGDFGYTPAPGERPNMVN